MLFLELFPVHVILQEKFRSLTCKPYSVRECALVASDSGYPFSNIGGVFVEMLLCLVDSCQILLVKKGGKPLQRL